AVAGGDEDQRSDGPRREGLPVATRTRKRRGVKVASADLGTARGARRYGGIGLGLPAKDRTNRVVECREAARNLRQLSSGGRVSRPRARSQAANRRGDHQR